MDCGDFLEGYSDYLDRRFEERPARQYENHLEECPTCAEYDRVMRRGLHLVRALDPPEAPTDLLPTFEARLFDRAAQGGSAGEQGRMLAAAGLTAVAFALVASLALLRSSGAAVQLPPVVVEAAGDAQASNSLWGPPPTFTTSASLLAAPVFPADSTLGVRLGRASLFRAPLREIPPPVRPQESPQE